jgi:methionyl-tRNA synthetase
VQALFRKIRDNGYIYKGTYTGQYCVFDELYVDGAQPGDPCPNAGAHGNGQEENYFFKLSAFRTSCWSSTRSRTSSVPRRGATK